MAFSENNTPSGHTPMLKYRLDTGDVVAGALDSTALNVDES